MSRRPHPLPAVDLPAAAGAPAAPNVTPDQLGALDRWEQSLRADPSLPPQSLQAEIGRIREIRRAYGNNPDEGPTFDRGAHADAR